MKDAINKYYVYHLIDPKDYYPFYVGKGYDDRMYSHEKETKRGVLPNKNRYLYNSIKEILNDNLNIIYKKVLTDLNEKDAFLLETSEIKKYGRKNNKTGILTNMTDGGEGMSGLKHTDISKKKMSDANKGKKFSDIRKKKISDMFSGKGNPFYGKTHNKETIDKLSKILKEKYIGKIHPLKGKPKSLEHRKKISECQRGRKASEETKNKMSLSHRKRCEISNELKNKIIELYNRGDGCKKILRILKEKYSFDKSIQTIKSVLHALGFDLSKRSVLPTKIKCKLDTGEVKIFNSMKETDSFIGSGGNLSKILKRGGIYKNFFIEKLSTNAADKLIV